MGGNGGYSKSIGGVPENARTHIDTGVRIGGHKVLLQKANDKQLKNILNSNSDSPIYLISKIDKRYGCVKIETIDIFDGHKLSVEINIKYDSQGNVIPYKKGTGGTSHAHLWQQGVNGGLVRKRDDKSNVFDIPTKYSGLIKQIENFNKENHFVDK